MLFINNN